MIKKISLPTRALVTLANNAVENENFPNSDEMNAFFDKFSQYCQITTKPMLSPLI